LNLRSNDLEGPNPTTMVPYLEKLGVSNNSFSGYIAMGLFG